ncbi:tubulin binding cofactor C-domain-containing protein [Sphaerosporella brunnea]|uniref:Tubulin binding cofactor C-domain-containing protein n=1 Tax=Sphaerosporella brunnea TaxID=1250544 RepID=A0A5J5EGU2_9PEZI|nr:tubulin binding cofactor C-domain-containing protein [Sphaerosporella brunnea]
MSSVDDSKGAVHTIFQEKHKEAESLLEKLRTAPANEHPQIIDACLAGISHLSDLLKDAASYLPAYDQRSYSLKVKALTNQLSSIRQSLAPKQKFTFKSKRNTGATIGGALDLGKSTSPTPSSGTQKVGVEQENLLISTRTREHIRPLTAPSSASASLLLSNLTDCIVSIPEGLRFSSSAIKDVSGCLLLLGKDAVDGPVHLTDVKDSTLVFGCRQFRMHDARNVDVFLHCRSRPIIEDCSEIRFHTYCGEEGNFWDQVDDFKWLRSERSPHWSASPTTEEDEKRWQDIGGKEVGELEVAKVLNKVLGQPTAEE